MNQGKVPLWSALSSAFPTLSSYLQRLVLQTFFRMTYWWQLPPLPIKGMLQEWEGGGGGLLTRLAPLFKTEAAPLSPKHIQTANMRTVCALLGLLAAVHCMPVSQETMEEQRFAQVGSLMLPSGTAGNCNADKKWDSKVFLFFLRATWKTFSTWRRKLGLQFDGVSARWPVSS